MSTKMLAFAGLAGAAASCGLATGAFISGSMLMSRSAAGSTTVMLGALGGTSGARNAALAEATVTGCGEAALVVARAGSPGG